MCYISKETKTKHTGKGENIMKKRFNVKKVVATAMAVAVSLTSIHGLDMIGATKVKAASAVEDSISNSIEDATAVTVGKKASGYLNDGKDVDYYKFTTDGTESYYWFEIVNTSDDVEIDYKIYADADEIEEIASDNWGLNAKVKETRSLKKLQQNQTYYIRIAAYGQRGAGKYNFTLTSKLDKEPDQKDIDKAINVAVGAEAQGTLEENGDVDCYKFTTDSSDSFYWFSMDNIGDVGEVAFALYADIELTERITNDYFGVECKANETNFLNKLNKNQTYYVVVTTYSNQAGASYRFQVTKKADNEPDTAQEAKTFSVGKTVSEKLEANVDKDYYKFTTDSSDSFYWFSIDNTADKAELYYAVYADVERTEKIAESYFGVNCKANQTSFLGKLNKKQTYYVEISPYGQGDEGVYSFKVRKAKDDVKEDVKNAKNIELNTTYSNYKLQADADVDVFKFKTSYFTNYTLTFANVNSEGNIKYAIYSGKDCLDSQLVASGECGKKQSVDDYYKNLKLKADKTYYVKISGNYRSENGKYKLGIYAKAPEGTSVKKSSAKKVTLGWKKLSQANGYEVYRATKRDGSYKKIKTITKNSTVKFVDKNVKKNKTYFYKVRAYKVKKGKKCYSAFSAIKSIRVK